VINQTREIWGASIITQWSVGKRECLNVKPRMLPPDVAPDPGCCPLSEFAIGFKGECLDVKPDPGGFRGYCRGN
jgi:hypothetical protein